MLHFVPAYFSHLLPSLNLHSQTCERGICPHPGSGIRPIDVHSLLFIRPLVNLSIHLSFSAHAPVHQSSHPSLHPSGMFRPLHLSGGLSNYPSISLQLPFGAWTHSLASFCRRPDAINPMHYAFHQNGCRNPNCPRACNHIPIPPGSARHRDLSSFREECLRRADFQ